MCANIMVSLGTRPEIIKLAPVIREMDERGGIDYSLIHTGQHYDHNMNEVFFDNLGIGSPDINLEIGSGPHGEQTAEALEKIEHQIIRIEPEVVLSQGDTNSVLATALATSKTTPIFGHVEAGIRSGDDSMPEEINRRLADQVSDIAFAPTEVAVDNLKNEGISKGVFNTGNTIVDACRQHIDIAEDISNIGARLDTKPGNYAVATIHRPINTQSVERLRDIIVGLDSQEFPVVFPVHPRTKNTLEEINYNIGDSLIIIDPVDYFDFLKLLKDARLVVTDSGGIQEEASIVETPCLTVRPNTERPETIDAGVNELIEPGEVGGRMSMVFSDDGIAQNMKGATELYGDGTASIQIIDLLEEKFL